MDIAPPANVAETINELFGARGADWLAALPTLVTDLCRRWRLRITGPPYSGGSHSYVVPVRCDDMHAVLKVPVRDNENYAEAAALRCYAGDGAVRLYDVDPDTGALLLEPAANDSLLAGYERGELDLGETADTAAGLLHRLQRVPSGDLTGPTPGPPADPDAIYAPAEGPFPLVTDLARRWAVELPARYEAIGRPCDARLFDEAAQLAVQFATPDGPELLVNRDGHTGNMLRGNRSGRPWLLIDPKPMVGEAAFDAGHLFWDLIRQDPTAGRARFLVDRLAASLAVDPERVRGWALIRCVDDITWAAPEGEAAGYIATATALATLA